MPHPEIDTFTDLMDLNELTDIFFDKDKQSGNYILNQNKAVRSGLFLIM